MSIVPSSKPQASRAQVLEIVAKAGLTIPEEPVFLVAVRGYYRDSMGVPGKNDRGLYDDAVFVFGPEAFVSYNFNVDPSASRKGMANLKVGVSRYKVGIHGLSKPKPQQYQAYVQAAPVTVIRDQTGADTGWFGINIHRGGRGTTSSLGCQTVPPAQWDSFNALVKDLLKRENQKTFPYLLADV